jgi:hypothetical protein
MLLSAELGKDDDNNNNRITMTISLLLFPASYPKLRDFYSVAFFFLMLVSMPSCIKNTIAIFAPSGNTFAMLVKGIHVKDPSYYSN